MCGDMNLIMDPKLDTYNYTTINNPKSRKVVIEMLESLEISDIYRELHPNTKRYTWRRKNPIKQARLDYFFGSSNIIDVTNSCKIRPGYRSDHSIVELELLLDPFVRGKGIWRFNNSLLRNTEYTKSVKNWIREIKEQYMAPVYNLDNIDQIDNSNLQFTISDSTFLEMLLLKIRGNTIKFSSNLARSRRQEELNLIQEIEHLENSDQIGSETALDEKKRNWKS